MIKKLISAVLAASCLSACSTSSYTHAKVFTRTSSDVSLPQYSIELNTKDLNTFKNNYVPTNWECNDFYKNQLASCESSSAKATDKCIAKKLLDIIEDTVKNACEELKLDNQCPEENIVIKATLFDKRNNFSAFFLPYTKEIFFDSMAIPYSKISDKTIDAFFPSPKNNLKIKKFRDSYDLKSTFKHELTHQYINEKLGMMPRWLNEGFATQHDLDRQDITKEEVLAVSKTYDFSKNFNYILDFPAEQRSDAYIFNHLFINEWLKIPGNSLNKLIDDIAEDLSFTNYWRKLSFFKKLVSILLFNAFDDYENYRNKIYYDYIMNTGGKEILEKLEEIKQQNTNNHVTETTEKQTNSQTKKATNPIIGLFVALLTLFDLYQTLFG